MVKWDVPEAALGSELAERCGTLKMTLVELKKM
jgi:hypothetical protein